MLKFEPEYQSLDVKSMLLLLLEGTKSLLGNTDKLSNKIDYVFNKLDNNMSEPSTVEIQYEFPEIVNEIKEEIDYHICIDNFPISRSGKEEFNMKIQNKSTVNESNYQNSNNVLNLNNDIIEWDEEVLFDLTDLKSVESNEDRCLDLGYSTFSTSSMIEVSSDIQINKLEQTSIFDNNFTSMNDTNMSNDITIIDNKQDGIIQPQSNNFINDYHDKHQEDCSDEKLNYQIERVVNFKSDSADELKYVENINEKHMFFSDKFSPGVGHALLIDAKHSEKYPMLVKEADSTRSNMVMDIPRRMLWDPGISNCNYGWHSNIFL